MTDAVRLKWLLSESDARAGAAAEKLPLLSVSISWGVRRREASDATTRAASEDLSNYKVCRAGNLVINRMRAFQGALGIAGEDGIVSPDYAVLQVAPEVDARWLNYFLTSEATVATMSSLVRGIGGTEAGNVRTPRLNISDLQSMTAPLGSAIQQRTTADYLDHETARIDTLVEEQQRLIEMLRERRAAAIATRLESLGGMTRLKHVSTVQTGVTLSGEGDLTDPEWPYLRVANVQIGYVDLQEIKTVRVPPDKAAMSMLRPGDVLMTEGGDIDKLGRGALWRGELPDTLHQNHIFAVRPDKTLDSEFLVYWLDGPVARTYFRTTAKQTTNLAGTNKWTLGNLPVPAPPLNEQRRLVETLDEQTAQIDTLIAETERFVELSRERRAALITAAVTGHIDVREMA